MSNAEKVYEIVIQIPKGKVLTYGRVAEMAGIKSARVVGSILHQNPDPKNIPCHRVVRSDGHLATGYAFGGRQKQKEKLMEEGIDFDNDRVDLSNFLL